MSEVESRLERNIQIYSWYKIFTKRLYLPLISIQLVLVGKVTLEELALITIVTGIVQALLQIPTGYFADTYGNRRSVMLGAAISMFSPLFYVFAPTFWGGLAASVLFFGGYAFQAGAIEALIHDTLIRLGKAGDYTKVMGRAQTYGLIGNTILIMVVPATYALHQSLPFIIGFLSLAIMWILTIQFEDPGIVHKESGRVHPLSIARKIVTMRNLSLFLFSGFLTGVSNIGGKFRELMLQDLGLAISLLGVTLALGSMLGALMGWYLHVFDRFKPLTFYAIDLLVLTGCMMLAGGFYNLYTTMAAFIIFAGYTRIRMIVFQSKLLEETTHRHKATLLSVLSMFTLGGETIVVLVLTRSVVEFGYGNGYLLFGLASLALGALLWAGMYVSHRRYPVLAGAALDS